VLGSSLYLCRMHCAVILVAIVELRFRSTLGHRLGRPVVGQRRRSRRVVGSCFWSVRETREHAGCVVCPGLQRVPWSSLRPSWNNQATPWSRPYPYVILARQTHALSRACIFWHSPRRRHRVFLLSLYNASPPRDSVERRFQQGKQPKLSVVSALLLDSREQAETSRASGQDPTQPSTSLTGPSRISEYVLRLAPNISLRSERPGRLATAHHDSNRTFRTQRSSLSTTHYRHPSNEKQNFPPIRSRLLISVSGITTHKRAPITRVCFCPTRHGIMMRTRA
jgi:hypothetical protein